MPGAHAQRSIRQSLCVCVCVFVPSVSAFFRGLWAKVSVSTDIIPCFLS